jgi:hypothetical protein
MALHHAGPLELLQGSFRHDRVLRDGLDLEHAPVGLKPDLAECRQAEALAEVEVAGVVDGGFGAQGLPLFVILLDARALVVEVQRRDHAVGNDARAEGPGVALVMLRSKINCTCLGRPRSRLRELPARRTSGRSPDGPALG